MKNILLLSLLISAVFTTNAQQIQDASVENSSLSIQTGFLGIWVNNENRLSNSIALRTELGFDAGAFGDNFSSGTFFVLVPAITIEPRWYYNLNKRVSKSKRIDGNSGNFISIKTTYHPDLVIGDIPDYTNFLSDVSIVPTWGIRRHIGKHINYETGIGLGYAHIIKESNVYIKDTNLIALNLNLRIGYTF